MKITVSGREIKPETPAVRGVSAAARSIHLLATLIIGEAGIVRWPLRWIHETPYHVTMVIYCFLLLIVVYDFISRRQIHPATLWGGLFLILYEETQSLIGHSQVWHGAASWILHLWPKSWG